MTQQGEKGSYSESLVAVADNLEVDGVAVKVVREEGDKGVYRHHEEDAYDAAYRLRRLLRSQKWRIDCRESGREV